MAFVAAIPFILQAVPVAVSAITTLYGDKEQNPSGGPVSKDQVINLYAESIAKEHNTTKEEVLKDIQANPDRYKDGLDKLMAGLAEKNTKAEDPRGYIQKIAEDVDKGASAVLATQEKVHTAAESSFGFLTNLISSAIVAPITLAQKGYAKVSGQKSTAEQTAEIKARNEQLKAQGMTDADIKQYWARKRQQPVHRPVHRRTGQGELSGLQIAKLVLLVIVIIIVFASAATGSKMILGFLPFLLLGLGGMFLYDYLKTETPKQ